MQFNIKKPNQPNKQPNQKKMVGINLISIQAAHAAQLEKNK